MQKERKDKHFIKKPIYEGGLKAMRMFIKENLKYPKAALENKIEGTVYVKYTISHLGKVVDAKVVSSLGYGCDKEAMRLVKLLKFKVPKNRQKGLKFHKNLQIHFRLPKEKPTKKIEAVPKSTTHQIQYTYTTSKSKPKKDNPPKKGGTNYTIHIKY